MLSKESIFSNLPAYLSTSEYQIISVCVGDFRRWRIEWYLISRGGIAPKSKKFGSAIFVDPIGKFFAMVVDDLDVGKKSV